MNMFHATTSVIIVHVFHKQKQAHGVVLLEDSENELEKIIFDRERIQFQNIIK